MATYSGGFILSTWCKSNLTLLPAKTLTFLFTLRACLHGGVGPQIGEVTCGGSPRLLWTANDLGRLRIRLLLIKRHVNLLNKIYNYISVPISAKHWNATWIGSYQLFQRKTKFVVSRLFIFFLFCSLNFCHICNILNSVPSIFNRTPSKLRMHSFLLGELKHTTITNT